MVEVVSADTSESAEIPPVSLVDLPPLNETDRDRLIAMIFHPTELFQDVRACLRLAALDRADRVRFPVEEENAASRFLHNNLLGKGVVEVSPGHSGHYRLAS